MTCTTPVGRKEPIGFTDGAQESGEDWRELLVGLKRRGFTVPPKPVVTEGAILFWKVLGEIGPTCPERRGLMNKTENVLNTLLKSQQPKAKNARQEIWMVGLGSWRQTRRLH